MFLRPRPVARIGRTAVVAGTATAVSNRVSHRQANRWEGQEQPAAAPTAAQQAPSASAAVGAPSDIEQLQQLAKLHEQGILTDDEFAAKKRQILGI